MDIRDIRDEGLRRCRSGEMVVDVATDLALCPISADATEHLVFLGITRVIHDALKEGRYGPDDLTAENESSRVRPVANPPATKLFRMYAASDGLRKTLLDFTLADWGAFYLAAASETTAWGKLAKAAKLAIDALEKSGAKSVAELPEYIKAKITQALP